MFSRSHFLRRKEDAEIIIIQLKCQRYRILEKEGDRNGKMRLNRLACQNPPRRR